MTAPATPPPGYRWATPRQVENPSPQHALVPLTVDSTGRPYTQDEADVVEPIPGALDFSSSASRQHYIDTGYYLPKA